MNKKARRMQAAVIVFALAALGALAVSPRAASTEEDTPVEKPTANTNTQVSTVTTVDRYNNGYQAGYRDGKSAQQQQDANNANTDSNSASKGGCCGGGA